MPPRPQTLDPDSCPEHAAHCGRLDRCDKRLELLEEGERDHEHRITVIEVEGASRVKAAAAIAPIVVALISAAVAIWSAARKDSPKWPDTHSYTVPAASLSSSARSP